MKETENKIVVALYSHIEFYPPSINAVQSLSKSFDKIVVVCNNVLKNEFPYHSNIEILSLGSFMPIRQFERKPLFKKIVTFFQYVLLLKKQLKGAKIFIAYDGIPLLAFRIACLLAPFTKKPILWYHNHDVYEPGLNKKYSIGWFAEKNESSIFSQLDIFSLPSNDRKVFFPMDNLKGKYFYLPNYPSKELYKQFQQKNRTITDSFSILFQGSIGEGHGIEIIIEILQKLNESIKCSLVLKGFISETYKSTLTELANKNNSLQYIIFKGVTPYLEVPLLTASCHIGIAIHSKTDRMNKTLGTASNKIYEYAACGLPVLYFDNEHYNKHLAMYDWAFGVDLSQESIQRAINKIVADYTNLSSQAMNEFNNGLYFESNFQKAVDYSKQIQN